MYEVSVSENEINFISKHIIGNWYMHFWKSDKNIIAIFKDKVFKFNYDVKDSWKEVLDYGISIGIPVQELDFPINGL